MKHLPAICALMTGAIVGAAMGVLFAPERGVDTREKINQLLREKGIKLDNGELNDLVDKIANHVHPKAE